MLGFCALSHPAPRTANEANEFWKGTGLRRGKSGAGHASGLCPLQVVYNGVENLKLDSMLDIFLVAVATYLTKPA